LLDSLNTDLLQLVLDLRERQEPEAGEIYRKISFIISYASSNIIRVFKLKTMRNWKFTQNFCWKHEDKISFRRVEER
jgi:hypothetical protein